jgi:hypothetical protein
MKSTGVPQVDILQANDPFIEWPQLEILEEEASGEDFSSDEDEESTEDA